VQAHAKQQVYRFRVTAIFQPLRLIKAILVNESRRWEGQCRLLKARA
jgi:hypothetical protein